MRCAGTPLKLMLLAAVACCSTESAAQAAPAADNERLAQIREAIEVPFRLQAGIGFRSFDCDLPLSVAGEASALEFSCAAVDEEGDRFTYRLWRDRESGETRVSQWQPAGQVPDSVRLPLTKAAEVFLDGFASQDWTQVAGSRHPALVDIQDAAALRESLGSLRERIGSIQARTLQQISQPEADSFSLEYALKSAQGPLQARLQLREVEEGYAVSGYMITPEDGTPLAAAMLAEQASLSLATLIGSEVIALEVETQRLRRAGDSAVGQVRLAKGQPLAVLVSRVGTAYDFDQNDYRFSILDLPWIVARHEVQNDRPQSTVQCAERFAADGESVLCKVTRSDASEHIYRIERRGGEHRMSEEK